MPLTAVPRWAPAALFVFALAVRLGHLAATGAPDVSKGDALEYHTYATNLSALARYEGPDGSRAGRMPGYPLFLASVYRVAGPSPLAAALVQCLLGASACLALLGAARRLLPLPWALACAAAGAAYYGLAAPSAQILTECLYASLLAWALSRLYAEGPPWRRAAESGALLAGAALTRPELAPLALVGLAAAPKILPELRPRDALVGVLAFSLPLALWVARNMLVLGAFVPATTNGGNVRYMTLYVSALARGADPGPVFVPPPGLGELDRSRAYAAAADAFGPRTGLLRIIREKAFNVVSIFYPFLPGYDVTYMLLAPFGLFGLLAAARSRLWWPVAAPLVFSVVVFSVFGGPASRYRQAFAPCLVLLSFLGLHQARVAVPAAWPRIVWSWGAANVAVWLFAPQARRAALLVKGLFLD